MKTKNGSLAQGTDGRFCIGELARATDVPINTIRFYEDVGRRHWFGVRVILWSHAAKILAHKNSLLTFQRLEGV